MSKHFVGMAQNLLGEVESEQVMAIMLETPSNLNGMSALQIAVDNKMMYFLQDPRIAAFSDTMWTERKFIHPNKHFGGELSTWQSWRRLVKTPAKFYFSPSGFYTVNVCLYAWYLLIFSLVTLNLRYNYESDTSGLEGILWFFNVGYVLFVCYSLFTHPETYMLTARSQYEVVMSVVWILIFIVRFVDKPTAVKNDDDGSVNGLASRQQKRVYIYIALWSMQCLLFWSKVIFFFRRLRNVGPMVTMIILMIKDIFVFLLLAVLMWIGSSLALYYVIPRIPI